MSAPRTASGKRLVQIAERDALDNASRHSEHFNWTPIREEVLAIEQEAVADVLAKVSAAIAAKIHRPNDPDWEGWNDALLAAIEELRDAG